MDVIPRSHTQTWEFKVTMRPPWIDKSNTSENMLRKFLFHFYWGKEEFNTAHYPRNLALEGTERKQNLDSVSSIRKPNSRIHPYSLLLLYARHRCHCEGIYARAGTEVLAEPQHPGTPGPRLRVCCRRGCRDPTTSSIVAFPLVLSPSFFSLASQQLKRISVRNTQCIWTPTGDLGPQTRYQ